MSFNVRNNVQASYQSISNKELDDELLDYLITSTVCETYLIHSNVDRIGRFDKEYLLSLCGRIKLLIRECGPPPELITGIELTVDMVEAHNNKITRLLIMKSSLNVAEIETIPITCQADVFLVTLLISVKNEVVSLQSFMRKQKLKKISSLKSTLEILKKNYVQNLDEILTKENSLNKLIDNEMRLEMEKFRHFDIINMEKMTPRFLALSRASKKTIRLDVIRDSNDREFSNNNDRTEYIRKSMLISINRIRISYNCQIIA
jgi:hypothetical protein